MSIPPGQSSPRGLRRFFLWDGRLHPVWRVTAYLLVGFVGALIWQSIIVIPYLLYLTATGTDPEAILAQLGAAELPPTLLVLLSMLGLLWTLLVTWAFRRWLDHAPVRDLGFARLAFWRDAGLGLALGLISMALIFGLFWTLGWVRAGLAMTWERALLALLLAALALAPAAASEEIVYRGYVLQTLAGWRGWTLGLLASATLFALAHWQNPSLSGLGLVNLALAGLVLGLLYRATRRLWLAIAYHFMWNFAQGPLLGFPVSGLSFGTLLATEVSGPALLTGGAFGPEGGAVVSLVLLLSLGLALRFQPRPASAG